jgi:hypothetical protein
MRHIGRRFAMVAAASFLAAACTDQPITQATPTAAAPPAAPSATYGPPGSPGSLLWFGYAAGAEDDVSLTGTDSYANWGEVITDSVAGSTWATQRINALAAHNMKAVVELGQLLWRPPYGQLYSNFQTRWNTWKAANASVLNSTNVIAFIIRDEPFWSGVDIASYQAAAAMVKADFPWAKILLLEAAVAVADPNPGSNFNQAWQQITTVDWVGVNRYAINPASDATFQTAVAKIKQRYPGRKMVYVADGYWDSEHATQFLGANVNYMGDVMRQWYDVARADPDAIMLAVFIWNPLSGATSSRQFPPSVLYEHTRVGRAITGRTRTQLYAPTGFLETVNQAGEAKGWACDPDGAWGETVQVDLYANGVYYTTTQADQPDIFRTQCRSGTSHRFKMTLGIGSSGQQITAVARDLNSGSTQLPSYCAENPACIWYYIP